MTEAFIVVPTAEEAVDRLAALHERATTALSQALKRYLKDRIEPSAQERALFRYPELRLTYRFHGEVPVITRAYAKVQLPGTYSVTVTHPAAFRNYLLEQLVPLMRDFTVDVEVGVSQQNIPYPYVVEQGDELAGSGVTAAALARVFPSTDLSAATDGIADGLYVWENTDPLPLALFDAARVDFSLRRLVHYTGSDWRHVQPWILLTNYHRYVDQFIHHGIRQLLDNPRFIRLVLPGDVELRKGMDEGEMQALAEGVAWHRYQMPAYHLIAADGHGQTLINIGVEAAATGISSGFFYGVGLFFCAPAAFILLYDLYRMLSGQLQEKELIRVKESQEELDESEIQELQEEMERESKKLASTSKGGKQS